jgi:hypothetical protein
MLVLGLAVLGLALLALGLVTRWTSALGAGLLALLGEYAVLFSSEGATLDRYTPAYAVGFLFVAEVAFWSIERRVPAWSDDWLLEWRLGRLAGVCVAAALVAGFVMVNAAAATGGGGIALESAGVVAAIGSIVLLALLMRRMLLR